MQGTYGLDVLKYSETVQTVALTSTPNEVLRGLGYWFFYGQDRLGPWIEAARDYTQHSYVILAGYTLVVLSLLAAAFLRWRHRVFFVLLLFVGVVISVGAHPYASPTPLGALFKAFANSSTAGLALRSTGRAAPLVVLALAVFLGLAANSVYARLRARGKVVLAYAVPVLVRRADLRQLPGARRRHVLRQEPATRREAAVVLDAGDRAARTRATTRPASSKCRAPTSRRTRGATPSTRSRPA